MWLAVHDHGETHVIPLNDLREHEESAACWCQPFDHDGITVHNSMDRREEYETGRQAS